MKKLIILFLTFGSSFAFAREMPMKPFLGRFSFQGASRITNKVRTIDIDAHLPQLQKIIQKFQSEGYTCAVLENESYECGRNEAVVQDDMAWIEKANVDAVGEWVKFEAPSEPPELEHAIGDSTIWSVTQETITSAEHNISEIEYSFSKNWKNISFFDSINMEENDFQIISESRIQKDLTYQQDDKEDGLNRHLEVVVGCYFDKDHF